MAVVKNQSNGYGYKYNSLADLDRAGVSIPKMRVKPTEFGEYVEYLDEKGEWQTGAKVVEFEMKGCNKAQSYGASLSYARRYTTMLANSVACDDDDQIEKHKPMDGEAKQEKPKGKFDFNEARKKMEGFQTMKELEDFWKNEVPTYAKQYLEKDKDKAKEFLGFMGDNNV